MKTISVLIATYNEEENVIPLYEAIAAEMKAKLPGYKYEIIFIDNYSTDTTREKIAWICGRDKDVKTIYNARNFGPHNSYFHGLLQTTGDCTIGMCADFQDPVEMIPEFVAQWEKGYRIVTGIKASSKENVLMYLVRSMYYKLIKKFAEVEQIEHFTGFGLYDRSFIDVLRKLDDPLPYFRGIVSELGYKRKEIRYEQPKRRAGRSKHNWYSLYDAAMVGITSYTKIGLRLATMTGFFLAMLNFVIGLVYLVYKLLYWEKFPLGTAPILIGMFFLGAMQLFFIGFLGEYIVNINARVMKRPLVVEEKRINFEAD